MRSSRPVVSVARSIALVAHKSESQQVVSNPAKRLERRARNEPGRHEQRLQDVLLHNVRNNTLAHVLHSQEGTAASARLRG